MRVRRIFWELAGNTSLSATMEDGTVYGNPSIGEFVVFTKYPSVSEAHSNQEKIICLE